MAGDLAKTLVEAFSGLTSLKYGRELIVFIISLMPILELRGGLIAAALLNINIVRAFIICFIGNIIPIPFILWLITPIFNYLKKTKIFSGVVNKLEKKAMSKKDKIEKLQYIGLLLFVGIPLPGTGAWTGCLIAALLNMDKKKAMLYAILGVIMAGIINVLPSMFMNLWNKLIPNGFIGILLFAAFILVFLIVIIGVIFVESAERRLPIQYANKSTISSNNQSYIPFKLNSAGVITVIFASAIMTIPQIISSFLKNGTFELIVSKYINYTTTTGLLLYIILII